MGARQRAHAGGPSLLRETQAEAFVAAERAAPRWTATAPTAGSTPVRTAHLSELRAAVMVQE